jgi:hypothetical protein
MEEERLELKRSGFAFVASSPGQGRIPPLMEIFIWIFIADVP